MVGVPGRSKACITCRQRKKGCDLKKPTCMQCNKAGLKCGGYDAPRVFVVSTPDTRRPGYSLKAAATSPPPSALWHRIQRNQVSSSIANLWLLARPEDERRCIDLFWEAYFPTGRPIPPQAIRSYTCTWTETARKLYSEEESLRHALWANCLLVMGSRHGMKWMRKEASVLYGKALSGLRVALGSPQRSRRDALIATVKLLGMFEQDSTATSDMPPSWQQHYTGELALFLVRTPRAHIEGDAHHVFADERVDMALSAILHRKRLPLSTPEWKCIPWQRIPKDMKDILVDALVELPGLVEDLDNMRLASDAHIRAGLRSELVKKCWECDAQLLSWLSLLTRIVSPVNGERPGPGASADSEAAPSSPTPKEKDLITQTARVHGMSLFFLASLVLYSVLGMASEADGPLPERIDTVYYARRLVDVLESLLKPEVGLYGRQSAAMEIEVALRYVAELASWSEEGRELLGSLKQLSDGLGKGLWPLVRGGML